MIPAAFLAVLASGVPVRAQDPPGVPTSYNAVTTRAVYPEPAPPVLGPAGYRFIDPAFGARLVRVTDSQTRPGAPGRSFTTASAAHQLAWSAASDRFWVRSIDGTFIPYTFDAKTMTAARIGATATGDGGVTVSSQVEPQFSFRSPDRLFGSRQDAVNDWPIIRQFDFNTLAYSDLLDLGTLTPIGRGTYAGALSTSATAPEKVSVIFGGEQDSHYKVAVFEVDTPASHPVVLDTLASTITRGGTTSTTHAALGFFLHHAWIDLSGRYVVLYPTRASPAAFVVWDLQTDLITFVTTRADGHDALGFERQVNQSCCTTTAYDGAQWQSRALSRPADTRDLIDPVPSPQEIYIADHTSWNNAQPEALVPILSSTYRYNDGTFNQTPWRAWDDEIVAVQTGADSSGATVWRFAHHRSDVSYDGGSPAELYFWYLPRAIISPDGRWAIFTSNWEKSLGRTLGSDAQAGGGYRSDVFLVALTPGDALETPNPARRNVALASAGGRAASVNEIDLGFRPEGAINGDRRGANIGNDDGWVGQRYTRPAWLQVEFVGTPTIDEVCVVSAQDDWRAPVEPSESLQFALYGLVDFHLESWDGAAWRPIAETAVAGNTQVVRCVQFPALTTSRIRLVVTRTPDGYTRLIELEAWTSASADAPGTPVVVTPPAVPGTPNLVRANAALASVGGRATAMNEYDGGFGAAGAIDGDRSGAQIGNNGGWMSRRNSSPSWLQVEFAGVRAIDEVCVIGAQDNWRAPVEPNTSLQFALYGLVDFHLESWNGAAWLLIPGTIVTGNTHVVRCLGFAPVTTERIRLVVTRTPDGYARVIEIEAWTASTTAGPSDTPPVTPPDDAVGTPDQLRVNVALAGTGARAMAVNEYGAGFGAAGANDGDRSGAQIGNNGGWMSRRDTSPAWLQVEFAGEPTIDEVCVIGAQDNWRAPVAPNGSLQFTLYGLVNFYLESWDGATWQPIPGTAATGNTQVVRCLTFASLTTRSIRLVATAAPDGYSRVIEIEAWTAR
jgi:hypothetical protein